MGWRRSRRDLCGLLFSYGLLIFFFFILEIFGQIRFRLEFGFGLRFWHFLRFLFPG